MIEELLKVPHDILIKGLNKTLYERSFYEFAKAAWQYVDATPYVDNWHIGCLCVHLQAMFEFKIELLDIAIPPGFAKSTICSVLFPAWCWINDPSCRILTGAYKMDLSMRDTVKARSLIRSRWFQENWGNRFSLDTTSQDQKTNYVNDKGGYRVGISTTEGNTGYRADIMLFDDPMSYQQAKSEADRATVNATVSLLYTRQDILKKTRMAIIGQRVHDDDPHSFIRGFTNCVTINIPLEFEKTDAFSNEFYSDPRKEEKELLWDIEKFKGVSLDNFKLSLGEQEYSAFYQQRPITLEGDLIKRNYWKFYDNNPHSDLTKLPPMNELRKTQGWDFAVKKTNTSDFAVCLLFGKHNEKYYIIDMFRERAGYQVGKEKCIELIEKELPRMVYIEDRANGSPTVEVLQEIPKYRALIKPVVPTVDKVQRLQAVLPIIAAGNVYLPANAPWLDIFLKECSMFPKKGKDIHDDIVDVLSMVLNEERKTSIEPRMTMFSF